MPLRIFNLQPIEVTEFVANHEYLATSHSNYSYESGFGFTGKMVESLKTMFVTFNIRYTVGGTDKSYPMPSSDDQNHYKIQIECGEDDDVFLSYSSSCQFNFENEGFDPDVSSLIDFLEVYDEHTKTFLHQYGYTRLLRMEEKVRISNTLKANAVIGIENLRANEMYEF